MSSGAIAAQPEKILRALGQVWTSLGEEERHQGKPTVLRACAMNLIVITGDEDKDSAEASQTLVELMHAHPSRAIVLRADGAAENGLSARVFAQCWKPFGKAQQICCEQIEVSAHPDRWIDVGPTVLGIIVPDLPVVVWCRLPSLLSASGAAELAALSTVLHLATKIIVDTRGADLKQAFRVLGEWRSDGRLVGDLEWTRLTPWRETIATAFDDSSSMKPSSFDSLEIGYGGSGVPGSALYLAAWLERGIAAKPVFQPEDGPQNCITSITLKSKTASIKLFRSGPSCLTLNVNGLEQRVNLAGSSYFELMHEELTVIGFDGVFDAAFARAGESYR